MNKTSVKKDSIIISIHNSSKLYNY